MGLTEALEIVPLDGRLGSAAMESSSQVAGVTPDGVREGDRAALQALVERRGPAVMAFCTRVCGPANAPRASAEAFARFRAAVRDALDLSALDPEALLRGATRHAAASMARTPSGPPPTGRLRSRGTQTCEHVPTMLAARANGALGEADLERLARHLDRCERCNAMGEIFRSAEAAYAEPAIETLGSDTTTVLVAAMVAVPEHAIGVAPEPLPGAPASEPQDGAFGHLPDLDDEIPVARAAEAVVTEVPEGEAEAVVTDVREGEAAAVLTEVPEAAAVLTEVPEGEADSAEAERAEAERAEAEAPAIEPVPVEAEHEAVADGADAPAGRASTEPEADHTVAFGALAVEHVGEPAEELHAEDLAAQPLPDEAPAAGEHEVDLGETVEWDMVPVAPQRRSFAEAGLGAVAFGAARRRRPNLGSIVKVALPVVLVAAFAVAALALTGILGGGDDPAPAVQHRVAPRVQKPVLTPLPVTVPDASAPPASTSSPAASAGASTGTGTGTGTATDAATAPGDAVGTTP
jgi:hypothetical protein